MILAEMLEFTAIVQDTDRVYVICGSGVYSLMQDTLEGECYQACGESGKRICLGGASVNAQPMTGWLYVEREEGMKPTEQSLPGYMQSLMHAHRMGQDELNIPAELSIRHGAESPDYGKYHQVLCGAARNLGYWANVWGAVISTRITPEEKHIISEFRYFVAGHMGVVEVGQYIESNDGCRAELSAPEGKRVAVALRAPNATSKTRLDYFLTIRLSAFPRQISDY